MSDSPQMQRRAPSGGHDEPATERFAIAAVPPPARWLLRGDAGVAARAGASFGLALPGRLGAIEVAGRAALWLGPDEWLLLAPEPEAKTILADLAAALEGTAHSLVDISHRQAGLRLTGLRVARVLSAGCPLDLRPAAFPVGMAARTVLAKAEVVLWRQGETRFHLEVGRSFVPYVTAYLCEAARGVPDM